MDTTRALGAVGGDGPFQYALISLTCTIRIVAFWSRHFYAYANYQPPWRCVQWKHNASLELGQYVGWNRTTGQHVGWNSTTDFISSHDQHSCDIYKACSIVEFEPGSSTLVTEWELMCDKDWIKSLFVSLMMVGNFLGCLIGGQLAERFGRKFAVFTSTGLHAIIALVSAFSTSWEMFLAIDFANGLCLGVIFGMCTTYALEFSGQKGLALLKVFPVMGLGALTFGAVAYFDRDWKSLMLIKAVMSVLVCLPGLWLPESMRWLYVKREMDRCEAIAKQISKWNGQKVCPTLNFDVFKAVDNSPKATYIDLFRTRKLTLITLGINYVGMACFVVYFMLELAIQTFDGDFYTNLLLYSMLEVPVCLIVAPVVKWMGNRNSLSVLFGMAFVCILSAVLVCLAVPQDTYTGGMVVTYLALVAKMSLSGCNQIAGIYSAELYPTTIRSLGAGLCSATMILSVVASVYLVPSTPGSLPVCFSIAIVILLLVLVDLYFLPETKQRPLQDFHCLNGHTETSAILPKDTRRTDTANGHTGPCPIIYGDVQRGSG